MTEYKNFTDPESENETFPVEPRYHPIHKIPRKIYDFFASAKLAMFLLVAILACCLVGVTIYRGARAGEIIFGTLWFNGLLVLLVINVACCFFGRIWHRKLTVISFGMILFHISFIAILLGVVYNSLFYFRGSIRLTEGETLPSGDVTSYDRLVQGRFFSFSRLKGETTLIRMHRDYRVGKDDKRAAYEIEVGEKGNKKKGIIFITKNLTNDDFTYFTDREGYSLFVMLRDRNGKEIYGAHLPLQSLMQKDGSFLYATGTKEGVAPFDFPQQPLKPVMALQLGLIPSKLNDRSGDVFYSVYSLAGDGSKSAGSTVTEGKVTLGQSFNAMNYKLSPSEVRYWVAMTVRYEPGQPIVLTSLWVALAGMVITTVGRMIRGRRKV